MQDQATNLKQFDNSWYNPGSALVRFLWMMCSAVFFRHSLAVGSSHKRIILKLFGAQLGESIVIKPAVNIKYPWKLSIGDFSWIGENCWIDNLDQVTIGAHVCLSQGSFLLCGNHNYKKQSFDLMIAPITLEDGVWIGAQSTVCPGVTCHSHAVLSVGSVATKDLEAYSIYQGVPAVRIKARSIEA